MRNILLAILLGGLLLTSCKEQDVNYTSNANYTTKIISGTSFGMCAGYCRTELTINENQGTLVKSAWGTPPTLPTQTTTGTISPQEWNALVRSLDVLALLKLADVIGCPDCADGGAEWIEVYHQSVHKKIVFEYGKDIASIKDLVDKVRQIRNRYEAM